VVSDAALLPDRRAGLCVKSTLSAAVCGGVADGKTDGLL